jgi:hypothetical protein
MNYYKELAEKISADRLESFEAGRTSAFKFVLEYLAEVPSAEGLESLIKKIQQREGAIA